MMRGLHALPPSPNSPLPSRAHLPPLPHADATARGPPAPPCSAQRPKPVRYSGGATAGSCPWGGWAPPELTYQSLGIHKRTWPACCS